MENLAGKKPGRKNCDQEKTYTEKDDGEKTEGEETRE